MFTQKTFGVLMLLLVFVFGCDGNNGGIPKPILKSISVAEPGQRFTINILNDSPGYHNDIEKEYGSPSYRTRRPVLRENSDSALTDIAPLGVWDPVHPFTTAGLSRYRIIRMKGNDSAASEWMNLEILSGPSTGNYTPGYISMCAIQGIEASMRHGMGDLEVLEAAATDWFEITPFLHSGAARIGELRKLRTMVANAEGGASVNLGTFRDAEAQFTPESLAVLDRVFSFAFASLARESGWPPRIPEAYGDCLVACGHSYPNLVDRYLLIVAGIAEEMLGLVEVSITQTHPISQTLSSAELGALAFAGTVYAGNLAGLMNDTLPGEASGEGAGQNDFELVSQSVLEMGSRVDAVFSRHFINTEFAPLYGNILTSAGQEFRRSCVADPGEMYDLIHEGYNRGLEKFTNGVPTAPFSIDIHVDQGDGVYTVTALTDLPEPGVILRLYFVSTDYSLVPYDAETNAQGVATFSEIVNGSPETVDILTVTSPGKNVQSSTAVPL